ncbi:MATH domain and coiled-coil domain-containing protein At2g42480-like isoform X2 [Citrus sinensis]|uniref:MATH domain and coiled-coil domain-containing protein At2g42480-like isoform X2 n=1 Tax=Citrus sinensis TaxID=2711 RepID=UPI002277C13C|nr:MATH domain and coiled-coil domain-containing protein At2g42480-like isoform X2 [Citrus sinensis]
MENKFVGQVAISRSISHVPPAHFLLKIEVFSSLVENEGEKYESLEFDAGGYKWKLVVYPNGNKNENVKDHISVYLAMVDTSSLGLGWEVYVIFRLFVLDQKKDEFLILQDAMGKQRRFHGLKLEWGFDQFIPLEKFINASNGYLVGDTCVFGAEVFVKETKKCTRECLSMTKLTSASICKYVWKIENFSKLEAKFYESEVFVAGDQKWKIQLYPKGHGVASGSHISMYLELADLSTITRGFKIYVHFTLRIRNQVQSIHNDCTTSDWFRTSIDNWGWHKFMELSYLNKAGNGFLVNDVCIVEAKVSVLGISDAL